MSQHDQFQVHQKAIADARAGRPTSHPAGIQEERRIESERASQQRNEEAFRKSGGFFTGSKSNIRPPKRNKGNAGKTESSGFGSEILKFAGGMFLLFVVISLLGGE